MDKIGQYEENSYALYIWRDVIDQWLDECDDISFNKLRSCKAVVYETSDYYILKSYNTIIAAIIKKNNTLLDMLRYVYGYTSTSAQHIAKFRHDYTPYPWDYPVLRWRKIK